MKTAQEVQKIKNELQQFSGSTLLYFNPFFKKINYTEGAKFVFDKCGASWLCTDICGYLLDYCIGEEFVNITLNVKVEKGTAEIIFDDGNDNVIFSHDYSFTDFPLEKIQFFYENKILYLPSER